MDLARFLHELSRKPQLGVPLIRFGPVAPLPPLVVPSALALLRASMATVTSADRRIAEDKGLNKTLDRERRRGEGSARERQRRSKNPSLPDKSWQTMNKKEVGGDAAVGADVNRVIPI